MSLPEASIGIEGVQTLPLARIQPNPEQPRTKFDPAALSELAESIRQQGIIQPILAEKKSDGTFIIIAGERRWRAAKEAGLEEVPVIVRDFTREQKLEIALVENIQREDLSPLEEARAYYNLMEALNLSQQEVADKVGKNRSTVANSLRLLKLPESIKASMEEGELTPGHARALLSVTNPADQQLLFHNIVNRNLSVREAETAATEMNRGHKGGSGSRPAASVSARPADPEMAALEQKFIEKLGTRVALKGNMNKGKMEISWFNQNDLDRIYEVIFSSAE
ncbi:MAG: chromosome partitioning protein ParB [Spirochaetales bacterium]|nr:MAG: chromosome partitioning protein ParB [Spirochaetales bacterium]